RQSWGRARYPVAAGYMAQVYLPMIGDLFKDLGLTATTIPEPGNSLFVPDGRRIIHDPFGKGLSELPESESVKRSLQTLAKDLAALSTGPALGQVPPVP